jgi:hypothetical protein
MSKDFLFHPVGPMQLEDVRRMQKEKELMDEVVFARYKAPYAQISLYMELAARDIEKAHVSGEISSTIRKFLFDVLHGKIPAPKTRDHPP